jgi:AcrR family transcriptional regulator
VGVVVERRKYDSPVRRQQAAETRNRIVVAGAELVHGFESWDWRTLTVRAVAEQAGVSERTVYRHFADEAALHDAVMQRLQEEAGVSVEDTTLDGFGDLAAGVYDYLSSFAVRPRPLRDPAFVAIDDRRREALLAAVEASAPAWEPADRAVVAAVLDVLWNVPTYERLRTAWELDTDDAARLARWVVALVEQAVREDRRP